MSLTQAEVNQLAEGTLILVTWNTVAPGAPSLVQEVHHYNVRVNNGVRYAFAGTSYIAALVNVGEAPQTQVWLDV